MSDRSRSPTDNPDARVIPVVEEQAFIVKRRTLTEGLRVRTVVREEEVEINEPLATETIEVERVPVDYWVEGSAPVRQEGDTTIVTLLEEVVVSEKRLRAIEEVRITRRRAVETGAQTITLHREEVVIERVAAARDDERDAG